ncbi:ABC transporter ATP-binding protein [Streptomyces sp. NPDC056500]|uniref:ABC transporter ATP-binding protein n=1 Tax=Streptomyces sp. NPDC056500 TaxID=3345840 RepID=UPI0036ABB529
MLRTLLGLFDPETARAYRRQLWLAASYALLEGVAFGLTLPTLTSVLDDGPHTWAWFSALAVAVVATLVLRAWQTDIALQTTIAAINALHRRIAHHLATLPVGWFSPAHTGSLIRAIWPGAVDVTKTVLLAMAPMLRGVITPAVIVVVTATVDWRPALVMVAAGPLLWLVHRRSSAVIDRSEERTHRAQSEATARIIEFAEAQPTLRASGQLGLGHRLLADALDEREQVMRTGVGRELLARAGFGTTIHLAVAALAAVVGWLLLHDDAHVALLIALLILVLRFTEPIGAVAELARGMRLCAASIRRAADILAAEPLAMASDPTPVPQPGADGGLQLTLQQVRLSYPDSDWTLDGIELDLPPGSTTALVGASGAGKSSLLRLAARFIDPDQGQVLLGGVDVRELSADDLYRSLGVVLQDVVLLEGTIRENVLLGRPGASEEELLAAARVAGVDEIVDRLPWGWETPVGSGSSGLSGGERQRVSLARVALQDAPVVLLDEATAALDPMNELVVRRWMRALAGRRTLLMVAHRLHTVVGADQIVVLDSGRILDRGTHHELLARCAKYQDLWRSHEEAAGWRLNSGASSR